MKKVLSALAALTVVSSASCFGAAAVSLNNYDANVPVFYGSAGTKAGAGCYIAIFNGADVISSTSGGTGVFSLADDPGFFDGGIGNIAGLADNAPATLTAVAWKGDGTLAGMAAATEKGTATWTQNTGANSPPNLPSPATLNLPSITITTAVIPEPTTIALGLIGAAGLLLFRRK